MEITRNITKNNIKAGRLKFYLLALVAIILVSCATSNQTPAKRHKNLSYLYNEGEAYLHPQYQIYNLQDDSSVVYFKIPFSDLLFRDLEGYDKYGLVELHYRVYESLSSGGIIDSATYLQKIKHIESRDSRIYSFKIKTPNLSKSYLNVRITDVFSERSRKDYIEIDKTRSINRQSFLIKDAETREPVFGNHLLIDQSYDVQCSKTYGKTLIVQEQDLIKSPAIVPYSMQRTPKHQMKSDTSYSCVDWSITPKEPKQFFLSFDTTRVKGVAFFAHDSLVNMLHTPYQMLEPLSYLMSPKEEKQAFEAENLKLALDKFWLKSAGNTRLASDLIRVYYHRVAVANKYFSSYKKGWQTDRGMVYIIYGEPSKIYKSQTLERWIYGSELADESLTFDFARRRNPFSDNVFVLDRDEYYQKSWFQAVDSWRNGRIYSIAK